MNGIDGSIVPALALSDMPSVNQTTDSPLDRTFGLAELLDQVRDRGPRLAILRHEGEADQYGALVFVQAGYVVGVPNEVKAISHGRSLEKDIRRGLRFRTAMLFAVCPPAW